MILYVLVKLFLIFHLNHMTKTKSGGVCLYDTESLAVCLVDITSLPECLVCGVTIRNEKGYVAVMYRSPSQSSIEFESFLVLNICLVAYFSRHHNLLLF